MLSYKSFGALAITQGFCAVNAVTEGKPVLAGIFAATTIINTYMAFREARQDILLRRKIMADFDAQLEADRPTMYLLNTPEIPRT